MNAFFDTNVFVYSVSKAPTDIRKRELEISLISESEVNLWDAAILAAAQELDCDTLYTEDLNHGQIYGTVRVVNPFL
jgi:predicted nucleic acid-binding protein